MSDQPKHIKGFEYWYTCRNLSETADHVDVSRTTVQNWYKKYNWEALAEQREKRDIDETFKRINDDLTNVIKQLFKINDELLYNFIVDLKKGKVRITTVSEYYKLADLMIRIASLNDDGNSGGEDKSTYKTFITCISDMKEVFEGLELKGGKLVEKR